MKSKKQMKLININKLKNFNIKQIIKKNIFYNNITW